MAIEINGTTGISSVNGSATTPALQGQDTDTGISFGTDEVNVVTNGTTRATFDSSGRVGIGTATPGNYEASGDDLVVSSSGETGITIVSSTSTGGNLYFADGTTGNEQFRGWISYSHNVDALRFGTTGDERFRIASDGTLQLRNSPGIDFSQIQTNATGMTSETLDSYEEGTWTPTISFNGNSVGVTYSVQDGYYTKIGNVVTLSFRVGISNKGSSTGNLRIHGLPFQPSTPAKRVSGILGEAMGSASRPCYVRTESSSSFMGVFQIGGGSVTDSNFTTFDNYGAITFQI